MRQTGAELIVLKPGEVTATQVQSENEANKCSLQRICEIFEDALDQCLQHMADWVGIPEGGHVSLYTDFGAASLGEASAELLLKANQSGNISNQTMFDEWKRRAILSPELEWEDEQARIEEQPIALGMVEDEPQPIPDPQPTSLLEVKEAPEVDLSAITEKLDQLAATVAEPQEATIDLSPIEDKINALASVVESLAASLATMRQQPVTQPVVILDPTSGAMKKQITINRDASGIITGAEVLQ